ncbi:MAG: UxaA family hydrolase [Alphaproteobacteria bacterium]|nr:UxaA family hydrolase [Alphaproteobacteria bacterium]
MANIAKKRDLSFRGFRRENGRVGVRNHVAILPLDDLSNAACEAVANNIKGTLALPHAYGRLQFGEDLDLHFRTLIGTGASPNVAACVVIGIEPGWTQRVVDGIKKLTGKPVSGFAIEGKGDLQTIADAGRVAKEFLQNASEMQREKCSIDELWVSTKCGESDTTSGLASCPTVGNLIDKVDPLGATSCFGETTELTGAEVVCAQRAISPAISKKFMAAFNAYQTVVERHKTNDLSESQPTKGNIAGGLTTIEEKAYGNFQKIGHKTKFIDVLKPAEMPTKGAGLYFMDTSSAAAECVTLQAAAGFVVHLFPTGQGNVIGNPIEPVIKLTANPKTARTMTEHIDLDVSGILRREMTLDQAGDALIDVMLRTCNGRLTAAEALGHREFVMTKLYQSA